MKRFLSGLLLLVASAAFGQGPNRFPPIALAGTDPTGTACSANAITQYQSALYFCSGGVYVLQSGVDATARTNAVSKSGDTMTGVLNDASGFVGPLTGHASLDLPLTGGTLSGPFAVQPTSIPYGTPSNVEAAAFYSSPSWSGYITPGITHNNQTYAIDIAGPGVETPYVYSRPGVDHGVLALGDGVQWTVHQTFIGTADNYSQGLSLGGITLYHPAPGDTYPWYTSSNSHSGLLGPDDEGTGALGGQTRELPDFTGTVTSLGTVSTLGGVSLPMAMPQVRANCTANCGYQGDGLVLINISRPILSTYATAWSWTGGLAPAQITINGTATVSTAWGTLAQNVATPVGNPTGVGLVSETFTVNLSSGCFVSGQTVWFADQLHDVGQVTAVGACTTTQSLTVLMRQPHRSGSWIMQGGTQGYGVFTAATSSINAVGLSGSYKYGVDIIGATGSHTLIATILGPASGFLANPPGPIMLGAFTTGS